MKQHHRRSLVAVLLAAALIAGGWIVLRQPPDGGRRAIADAAARLAEGDPHAAVSSAELAFRTLYDSGEAASIAALTRAATGDLPTALGRLEAAARRDPADAEAALEAGLVARSLARVARNGPQLRARAARWFEEAIRRADAVPATSLDARPFGAQILGVAARIASGDGRGALNRLDALRPLGAAERDQIVLLRAAAHSERGAFDEAVRVVADAIDGSPEPRLAAALARIEAWRAAAAEPAILTGLRAWTADDADLAARALERWVDVHPNDAAALAVLAATLARTGRDDLAAARYDTLAGQPPPRTAAAYFRGCHALASGRSADAVEALESACKLAGASASAPLVATLGVARAENGDTAGAEAALRQAFRADPAFTPAADRLADLLMRSGRAESARDVVQAALGASPTSVPLRIRLARIALATGDATAATIVLDGVVRDAPAVAAGRVLRGAVLATRKADTEAAAEFEAALKADRSNVDAHLGLLGVATRTGRLPERIAALEGLSAERPRDAVVQFVLGAAAELSGDLDRADREYRRALDSDPGFGLAANNRAWLLAVRLGRPAEALPLAERALRLLPRDPRVLDTAGWTRHLCGDSAGAEPLLRRARLAIPRDEGVERHLVRVLAAIAPARSDPERTPR